MKLKTKHIQHLVAISAASMITLGLTACSGGETNTPQNGDPDVGLDTSSDTDPVNNQAPDASPRVDADLDTTNPDPSDTAGAPDTTTAGDADVDPGEDDVYMIPDVEDYECFYPSQDPECAQGPFGPGSFIEQLVIVNNRSCCYDYTGDGQNDNRIGTLLGQLQALPGMGNVNDNIAYVINQGLLSYVFEFSNFAHPLYDPSLDLKIVLGEDTDEFFADNLAGEGSFNVLPESFKEDGTTPKWEFEQARVQNGRLIASGGSIDLTFPGLLDDVAISLVDVHVRARVADEAGKEPDLTAGGRVWLTTGELAGILLRDKLFESMNNAAHSCECIQDARPVMYSYDENQDKYNCELTDQDANRCSQAGAECANLGDKLICNFFAAYSENVDVDSSGDGTNDGYSVGVRFEAVGASLVGMAE
ncbi:MAG: hypothetical protein ACNA8W_09855 [Bradymonadaceae bacterium]